MAEGYISGKTSDVGATDFTSTVGTGRYHYLKTNYMNVLSVDFVTNTQITNTTTIWTAPENVRPPYNVVSYAFKIGDSAIFSRFGNLYTNGDLQQGASPSVNANTYMYFLFIW